MNPLEEHARKRLLEADLDSKQWFFWRGILLAFESTKENNLVTPEWADQVANP